MCMSRSLLSTIWVSDTVCKLEILRTVLMLYVLEFHLVSVKLLSFLCCMAIALPYSFGTSIFWEPRDSGMVTVSQNGYVFRKYVNPIWETLIDIGRCVLVITSCYHLAWIMPSAWLVGSTLAVAFSSINKSLNTTGHFVSMDLTIAFSALVDSCHNIPISVHGDIMIVTTAWSPIPSTANAVEYTDTNFYSAIVQQE